MMKKLNFRVGALAILLIIQYPFNIFSQTVELDGSAFLEGQSDHSGIKIVFERFAPQTLFDSTYSDSSGYFSMQLPQGIYNISYSNGGYIGMELEDIQAYSNVTLPEITLEPEGISGSISGVLAAGEYIVTSDIMVENGNSLVIEPGVTLRFKPEAAFLITGLLTAEGTETDSIVFTEYEEGSGWVGIQFGSSSDDNSVLSYAVIEKSNRSGLWIWLCSPTIKNSVIRNNHNVYLESHGGGIYLGYSNSILSNLAVYENEGAVGGGIYVKQMAENPNEGFRPVIQNCIINENSANSGAGIYFEIWIYNSVPVYPLVINSTIASNYVGGGVSTNALCLPDLINNIIAYNEGYGVISPLECINYFGYNTVSNNSAGNFYYPPEWVGENITVNSNGDSCDAYHNIQLDPQFDNLDENDFHLSLESPCIDAGLNDSVIITEDFEGNPRILTGLNDYIVDMGVYEKLPVSIKDKQQQELPQLQFRPNPACDHIQIICPLDLDGEECTVTIYNAQGEQIEHAINLTNSGILSVDVTSYSPGLYFAIIRKADASLAHGQFIVSR